MNTDDLIQAVDAALASEWDKAHGIVQQDERGAMACWLHAVLHKIEGDAWNSRYWYARSSHRYEEWDDARAELKAIRAELKTP